MYRIGLFPGPDLYSGGPWDFQPQKRCNLEPKDLRPTIACITGMLPNKGEDQKKGLLPDLRCIILRNKGE